MAARTCVHHTYGCGKSGDLTHSRCGTWVKMVQKEYKWMRYFENKRIWGTVAAVGDKWSNVHPLPVVGRLGIGTSWVDTVFCFLLFFFIPIITITITIIINLFFSWWLWWLWWLILSLLSSLFLFYYYYSYYYYRSHHLYCFHHHCFYHYFIPLPYFDSRVFDPFWILFFYSTLFEVVSLWPRKASASHTQRGVLRRWPNRFQLEDDNNNNNKNSNNNTTTTTNILLRGWRHISHHLQGKYTTTIRSRPRKLPNNSLTYPQTAPVGTKQYEWVKNIDNKNIRTTFAAFVDE